MRVSQADIRAPSSAVVEPSSTTAPSSSRISQADGRLERVRTAAGEEHPGLPAPSAGSLMLTLLRTACSGRPRTDVLAIGCRRRTAPAAAPGRAPAACRRPVAPRGRSTSSSAASPQLDVDHAVHRASPRRTTWPSTASGSPGRRRLLDPVQRGLQGVVAVDLVELAEQALTPVGVANEVRRARGVPGESATWSCCVRTPASSSRTANTVRAAAVARTLRRRRTTTVGRRGTAPPPGPGSRRAGRRARRRRRRRGAGQPVGGRVIIWSSSRSRRAAAPREAWLFTAPRLMPRVSAISASDRSR